MGLLRSLLRLGRRASDDEVVPDRPIYPPEDTLALGFEEVFVTLALVVLSYVVLATPCSSERRRWGSGGAHAGGRPDAAGGTATARWADALGQIRHVRSAEDLRRWWRRFRRTGGRADGRHGTVSFDPQRWDAVMRTGRHHDDDGVAASDRTVRASGGRGAPSAPLRSVFRPSVGGSNAHQKIHSSTSDGHLVGWSARGARGVGGEPPFYEGGFRPETDHDRFEKAWRSHICSAEYRRLVLPPECKLVEFVSRGEATEHYFLVESKVKEVASYLRNIFDILCGLFSKEGTRRFSVWIVGILHHNSRRRRGLAVEEDDETDEDDDDGSVTTLASNSSKRPTKGGQNQNHTHPEVSSVAPVNRTNSTENGEDDRKFSSPNCARQVGEETTREEEDRGDENDSSFMNVPSLATSNKRKESHSEKSLNDDATFVSASASAVESEDVNLDRSNSFSSRSPGIPLSVEGRPRSSLNVSPLPTKNYHCKPKKRDSLESYRRPEVKPIAMPSLKLAKDLAPEPDRVNLMPSSRKTNSQNPVATFRESSDMSFFDTANSSKDLRDMSRAVPIPDANGYILGDEFLGSSCTPLLVFVNSRSGPQQGHLLITQFRRLLNPIQVWDLANGGPEKVLKSFSVLSRFQVLVCGGDGTVSWIISSLERMSLKRWPPIGILPLGTGNDLARIHGWGGGYNNESLIYILRQLSEAYISILDLWELDITSTTKKGKQKKEVKAFLNYLGVGVDAQAALQVHLLRESKPKLFFSRMINKVHYAVAGGEEALKSSCANLSQQITLKADGREIPLPPDSQVSAPYPFILRINYCLLFILLSQLCRSFRRG